ncbi:hypothetical protein SAMN05421659_11925 [[Clostridium] fimetarium]|uniref:Uncharacterized protein n=1 Tax=[Clostridium] fimetarium TaxID=99656 RepID=A0A1I0RMG8_9FIRM|nr:hypothetical protein SAMN05421659_11925 [[Clostridium] fimetarium]
MISIATMLWKTGSFMSHFSLIRKFINYFTKSIEKQRFT